MRKVLSGILFGGTLLIGSATASQAASYFTETFATNDSNWGGAGTSSTTRAVPTYVSTGGPAGTGDGYIRNTVSLAASTLAQTAFRGQDNFDSSADAFVGNWQTAGIGLVSFDVRHDAPQATTIWLRIAPLANTPAWQIKTLDVAPNTWTTITVPISLSEAMSNPNWVYGGAPSSDPAVVTTRYNTLFNAVANVQILADNETPTVVASATFDLDNVATAVPEPTSLALFGAAAAIVVGRRRQNA